MGETNQINRVGVVPVHALDCTTLGQVTIIGAADQIVAANNLRHSLTIVNHSTTVSVYLGYDNSVSATTGMLLLPLQSVTFEGMDLAVWGFVSSGSAIVSYWELSD